MYFKEWITHKTKKNSPEKEKYSESSASKYSGAVAGRLSEMAISKGLAKENLLHVDSPFEIANKIKDLDEFVELNSTGNSMYSRALELFIEFSATARDTLQSDLEVTLSDKNLSRTEKMNLVKARLGQGKFRNELISLWDNCCALTGFSNKSFLVASHIKPWRVSSNSERLDKYNGFLLIANIDRAFDIGLISFNDEGFILIAKSFKDFKEVGLRHDMKINLSPKHIKYLEYHRENIFIGHNEL